MTPTGERVEPELPAAEILDHVIAGHTVALVDVKRDDAVAELRKMAVGLERVLGITLYRANGNERITHPSGGQAVPGHPGSFHGYTFDAAYVAIGVDLGKLEHLVPALAPANGELVWWER